MKFNPRLVALVSLASTLAILTPRPLLAITPDSPDVKAVLDRSFAYLETADDPRLGGKCLIALAFLKNGEGEGHPKIDAAVQACIAAIARPAAPIAGPQIAGPQMAGPGAGPGAMMPMPIPAMAPMPLPAIAPMPMALPAMVPMPGVAAPMPLPAMVPMPMPMPAVAPMPMALPAMVPMPAAAPMPMPAMMQPPANDPAKREQPKRDNAKNKRDPNKRDPMNAGMNPAAMMPAMPGAMNPAGMMPGQGKQGPVNPRGFVNRVNADIYSTGIAIIFLCSLNPSKYAPEILTLRDSLLARQKSHGGWGYPEKETGDTSMTQYGVLSLWEVSKVGLGTDVEATEQVANWIIHTEDPAGNWGYQGIEAKFVEEDGKKPRMELSKQDSAKLSMTVAGLGCTYMVADLLKLSELSAERDARLPPALRPIKKGPVQAPLTDKVDHRLIKAAQDRGRTWMAKNYKIDPPGFTYYYLYGLERYQSFLEAAENRFNKEPRWYTEGFVFLKKEQRDNGSWRETEADDSLTAVNTAFATLFLLRSTKKAIERSRAYGEATLVSGRGLPGNNQDVAVRSGRIVQAKIKVPAVQLVDILYAPDHKAFGTVAGDPELVKERLLALPAAEQTPQLLRLRTLASTGVVESRLSAVKVLGLVRDIGSSEALIAALDDPDWRVTLAADESLRSIGRLISATGLGEKPSNAARSEAIQGWKRWLITFRPDAEFLN